jgi:bacteriocin biosynthesis cyclodehydratase domain-containing protein
LIDHDRVELSNLNRQLLFSESDLGRLKVEAAAEALRAHHSGVEVVGLPRLVGGPGDVAELLDGAELLILSADWPPFELPRWVNRACLKAGVPFLCAAQFPPSVRVGPLVVPGRSACLECAERQTRRDHPLVDELAARPPAPSPAATLGAASGVAGSLIAMEALHLISGAFEPATIDTAVVVDLRGLVISREQVERDPGCPSCVALERDHARPAAKARFGSWIR